MLPGDFLDGFNMIMDIEYPNRRTVRFLVNSVNVMYPEAMGNGHEPIITRSGVINVECIDIGTASFERNFSYLNLNYDEVCEITLRTSTNATSSNSFSNARLCSYCYEPLDSANEIHLIKMSWMFNNHIAIARPPVELRSGYLDNANSPIQKQPIINWRVDGF